MSDSISLPHQRPGRIVPPVLSLLVIAALVLQGSCATPTAVSLSDTPWASRQVALGALQDWTLTGRISVLNQAEGWHASLRWVQTPEQYTIDITNPLGQSVARIRGGGGMVQVQTAEGELLTASDPDLLMEQVTGMRIPVSGLRYWIKGLPDPAESSVLAGDAEGRLTRLEQGGWLIEYPDYTRQAGLDLPARMRARQDDLKVQVVVNQWNASL